jgi:broad specificity phosphatase PhoE
MDITTAGATVQLTSKPLTAEKTVVIVRHGITTWNQQGRIQGSSDGSELTPFGEAQALRCKHAVSKMHFDSCFSSPIRRARSTAEIMWQDSEGPLLFLDSLKEAHLGFMEGMKQEEAATQHREAFTMWRTRPAEFHFDGRYPLREVFQASQEAWQTILHSPGHSHLVVTHKSMMRAFLCVALGLPETSFRAVDIHNGGVSIFRVNKRGEPMMTNMNMTAHMHHDSVFY